MTPTQETASVILDLLQLRNYKPNISNSALCQGVDAVGGHFESKY